jgi:glycosyltransferase involved in cell wall biosynthesis
MRIAVVTCYDQNDYVRARTLRTALQDAPGVETIVVRNRHKGFRRYPEVWWRLLKMRFGRQKPDAYLITFRGYETLLFLRLTALRKPIVFDEMVNMVEYYREHGKLHEGTFLDNLARRLYHWMVRRCKVILADTEAHADYSAAVSRMPRDKFTVVPMAAVETLFYPAAEPHLQKPFTVFYYANGMHPLHGLAHVLQAAVLLKDRTDIRFNIVGGRTQAVAAAEKACQQGAQLDYETWIAFEEIARRARNAGLCLGGPFGNTLQAQFVVTGKTTQFMASGAPTVVGKNKVGGMFTDRKNSLLVALDSPDEIASAIIWAADHPKELRAIAKNGRQTYEQYFSQAVVNRQVNEAVRKIQP